MNDLISRQAAIDAIAFGITYAKAINKETGEVIELFAESNGELRKAVDRVKVLPSVQPDIIRCKDCKYKKVYCFPPNYNKRNYCEKHEKVVDVADFCSWAER